MLLYTKVHDFSNQNHYIHVPLSDCWIVVCVYFLQSQKHRYIRTMTANNTVHGVILCGGKSSRFGSDKAWAKIHNKPLINHAIDTLSPQVHNIWLSVKHQKKAIDALQIPCIYDLPNHNGPLAATYSAMVYIQNHYAHNTPQWLCTLPVDTIGVPHNVVQILLEHACTSRVQFCYVSSAQGPQYALGIWNMQLCNHIAYHLEKNEQSIVRFLDSISYATTFLQDSTLHITNINRPCDLHNIA